MIPITDISGEKQYRHDFHLYDADELEILLQEILTWCKQKRAQYAEMEIISLDLASTDNERGQNKVTASIYISID